MKRLRSSGSVSAIDPSGSVDVLRQITDILRGIQGDVSQIITEYNAEVYAPLSPLPQGKSENRWYGMDDTINPRVNGLDAANIFVDAQTTSAELDGRYWYSTATSSRPKTVKESLNDIYTHLSTSLDQIRSELGAISTGNTIGIYNSSATAANLVDGAVRSIVFDGVTITAVSSSAGIVAVSAPTGDSYITMGQHYYTQLGSPIEEVIGEFEFDATRIPTGKSAYLRAMYNAVFSSAGTLKVKVYDIGAPGTPASPTQITADSPSTYNLQYTASGAETISSTYDVTPALIVGSSPSAGQIANSSRMYRITMIQNSTTGDTAYVGSAGLMVR
jgi:hypothetical protein